MPRLCSSASHCCDKTPGKISSTEERLVWDRGVRALSPWPASSVALRPTRGREPGGRSRWSRDAGFMGAKKRGGVGTGTSHSVPQWPASRSWTPVPRPSAVNSSWVSPQQYQSPVTHDFQRVPPVAAAVPGTRPSTGEPLEVTPGPAMTLVRDSTTVHLEQTGSC